MGEIDDHAWLFALAEPTLEQFSQRIADDLPDDLAVVCSVRASGFEVCSTNDDLDTSKQDYAEERCSAAITTTAQKCLLVGDSASVASYQISFSKNYRQQLLAVF